MLTIFISYKAGFNDVGETAADLLPYTSVTIRKKLRQPDSGLNSMPYVGSTITQADFSKNLIKEVRVFHLPDAINLEVSISR